MLLHSKQFGARQTHTTHSASPWTMTMHDQSQSLLLSCLINPPPSIKHAANAGEYICSPATTSGVVSRDPRTHMYRALHALTLAGLLPWRRRCAPIGSRAFACEETSAPSYTSTIKQRCRCAAPLPGGLFCPSERRIQCFRLIDRCERPPHAQLMLALSRDLGVVFTCNSSPARQHVI